MNILLFHVFLLYFHALPPLFTPPLSLSPHLSHYLPSLPSSLHCPASDSQQDPERPLQQPYPNGGSALWGGNCG